GDLSRTRGGHLTSSEREGSVSQFALAGTVLTRDLVAADGKLVASRGEIVDLAYLKETAARAPRDPRVRALPDTPASDDVPAARCCTPSACDTRRRSSARSGII